MAAYSKKLLVHSPHRRYPLDIFLKAQQAGIMAKNSHQIAFRYREADGPTGVTRETTQRLARALGVDETQAIHMALRELTNRTLPHYEQDDGPVSRQLVRALEKSAGPPPKTKAKANLFPDID
jgi:hypothetical protein